MSWTVSQCYGYTETKEEDPKADSGACSWVDRVANSDPKDKR
jgi:hypothetical protein